jgi:hypothetical protein
VGQDGEEAAAQIRQEGGIRTVQVRTRNLCFFRRESVAWALPTNGYFPNTCALRSNKGY